MKKHLLGLGIFSFIVVSFGIVYAFLFAPKIPQVPQVEDTRLYSVRNMCEIKSISKPNNRLEVVSTQYDLDEKKVISQIKINSNTYGKIPKVVKAEVSLFKVEQVEQVEPKNIILEQKTASVINVSEELNYAVFTVSVDLTKNPTLNQKDNFYAVFDVYLPDGSVLKKITTEPNSVLFVHGENSIIKK